MRRLWTPAWLARHTLAAGLVAACLAMAGWQYSRATGGNALSWGYTLQWPVFAGFVAFLWAREVRRTLRVDRESVAKPAPTSRRPVITRPVSTDAAYDDRGDAGLAAYNRYLEWLNANPRARPADYPR